MLVRIGIKDFQKTVSVGTTGTERRKGSKLRVDLSILYNVAEAVRGDDIGKTADYAMLYEIIEKQLNREVALLETLIAGIGREIERNFPENKGIRIRISKINPAGMKDAAETFVEWDNKGYG